MTRKIISLISIIAVLNLTSGCTMYSNETVLLEQLPLDQDHSISEVVLVSGGNVVFNESGGIYDEQREEVSGLDRVGKLVTVKAVDILYLKVRKVDDLASIGVTLAVIVGILGLFVLLVAASSCPLVYSFDGERFVFDAEPLGGSIAKGLEKTDWSRLEQLKERDGFYDLLVRNELPETQHLDEMRLLIADHPAGSRVYPDLTGKLHAVSDLIEAASAKNELGKDILPFVRQQDFTAWQSELPKDTSFRGGDTRHHLTFTFPRPNGSTTASLLVNAGTATWGSNMIRSMLKLRGDKLDDWYADVDAGGLEKLKLGMFILREELFVLKVYVKENGAWVHRGYIPGSGPYMTEDRLCALDLSNVRGDVLEIRLDPPRGYWVIDHMAVSYETPFEIAPHLLAASEIVDQDGHDVAPVLSVRDGIYHDMPVTGQYFTAHFPVPPKSPGLERSVFLQTSGWYELHLAKDTPEQTTLIQEVMGTPGKIVSYSLEEFLKWRTGNVAARN